MNNCVDSYSQMKKVINEYHELASRDSQMPVRWCVIGIQEWLSDFESQIPKLTQDESIRKIMLEDLKYEKKKLILLKVKNIVNSQRENKFLVGEEK